MAFAAVIALALCSGCSDESNNSILEEGPGMEQGEAIEPSRSFRWMMRSSPFASRH
jgi:hypothetical protein